MSGHFRGPLGSPRGYIDPDRPKTSWIRFVVEPETRRRLYEIADREKVTLSEICRRACRAYVEDAP